MRTVFDILQEKGSEIHSVQADATAFQALQMLAEKNIGALIVLQANHPVGLITERDYARKIAREGGQVHARYHRHRLLSYDFERSCGRLCR